MKRDLGKLQTITAMCQSVSWLSCAMCMCNIKWRLTCCWWRRGGCLLEGGGRRLLSWPRRWRSSCWTGGRGGRLRRTFWWSESEIRTWDYRYIPDKVWRGNVKWVDKTRLSRHTFLLKLKLPCYILLQLKIRRLWLADTFRQHCPWLLLVENSPAEKDGDHNNTNVVIYPIFISVIL